MNKTIKEKVTGGIRTTRKKVKAASDLTIKKAKALPMGTWNKFDGKKFVTGVILTAAAVTIDLYVPVAKPVSGYLMSTGIGMGLVGLGHKAIKHKAWIKALINKVTKKK